MAFIICSPSLSVSWHSIGFNRDIGGFSVSLTQTVPLRECHTQWWHTISWHRVDSPVEACHTPMNCHRGYMSQFSPSHLSQWFLPLSIQSLSQQIQEVTVGEFVGSEPLIAVTYIYVAVCVQDLILDFNWLNHYQASITMGSCVSYHWRKQQNPPTSSSIANQLTHAILLVSFAQKKWVCASDYFSGKVQWLPR